MPQLKLIKMQFWYKLHSMAKKTQESWVLNKYNIYTHNLNLYCFAFQFTSYQQQNWIILCSMEVETVSV
jgi:hypothetical protein